MGYMKTFIISLVAIVLVAVGGYFLLFGLPGKSTPAQNPEEMTPTSESTSTEEMQETASSTDEMQMNQKEEVIGTSVDGNDITAYHYGTGDKELLFVGDIHGGYEWNTALVAFDLMDYLDQNPDVIPEGVKVTVVPVLNPDGLKKIVGTTGRFTAADVTLSGSATEPGRFNANNVDLNRNFDCDWQAEGTWQSKTVSGGTAAFSEPESAAIRDYVQNHDITAAVVWYSAAGGVFSSSCHNGVLPETATLTDIYAKASGYKAYQEFNFYEITGDMVNWLAKENIPAISVLLTNHTGVEWDKNRAGIDAILNHYAQ